MSKIVVWERDDLFHLPFDQMARFIAANLSRWFEFGPPLELPHCGGWIRDRAIRDSGLRDAMGCYPVFACRDVGSVRVRSSSIRRRWPYSARGTLL